ncbi:OmpA family protein [Rhodovulum sp. DZ06]|uniref:OmpA family protein n=1 Tax=Rhodovulum sp. DZ06 TaxID=3425126 RepID=UPI003D355EBE
MRILFPALAACALALSGCAERAGLQSMAGSEVQSANFIAQAANGYNSQKMIATQARFRASTPDTVTFDFDSARLDAEARRVLDLQAQWLQLNPSVRMRVIGHADAVGPDGYNSRIGLRRARAVVAYLGKKGVARTRLDAVESRGERELLVETDERERRNRRTVTNVAGFERGFSGPGMNGRRAAAAYRRYIGDRTEGAGAARVGG